jgi:hypothetical protein
MTRFLRWSKKPLQREEADRMRLNLGGDFEVQEYRESNVKI